jgi:hypothetical protein
MTVHICRYCDGLITEEAVKVAEESGISGPGSTVWAHPEHVHLIEPDPRPLALLARIRALRARQLGGSG